MMVTDELFLFRARARSVLDFMHRWVEGWALHDFRAETHDIALTSIPGTAAACGNCSFVKWRMTCSLFFLF